jgi:RNA polymerase sigma-70 factor, ECF subfamily
MSDEIGTELLRRFIAGDHDAFETIFRQYHREVFLWIVRIVRDASAAEDVLVEAFWRVYRARARFDCSRSFGAWMRRIATNAALDHLKSARSLTNHFVSGDRYEGKTSVDRETNEAVARAFRRLPPKLRIVATLALIEELPNADIADALDVPVGTVKSRLFRATTSLRKELIRSGIRS